jgi:cis-L-3-hydroxyproline dehydratase
VNAPGQLAGRVLVPGTATASVLHVPRPLSFWGGVDPSSGAIIDPNQPVRGESVAGRVLVIRETIGSSSSSAIILELLRNGHAPAALVVGAVDAILTLGVIVAGELGYRTIPVVELSSELIDQIPAHGVVTIRDDGTVRPAEAGGA